MKIPINWGVIERLIENFRYRQGPGKHRGGKLRPRNHRLELRRRRKAQRQARRHARLCAQGRKHRYKGAA